MDEEAKLYVDVLKGLVVAGIVAAVFRNDTALARLLGIAFAGTSLTGAIMLVRGR